jgi:hypothetical protein
MQVFVALTNGNMITFPACSPSIARFPKSVSYEGGFVIVSDEWGRKMVIPGNVVTWVVELPDGVPMPNSNADTPDYIMGTIPQGAPVL